MERRPRQDTEREREMWRKPESYLLFGTQGDLCLRSYCQAATCDGCLQDLDVSLYFWNLLAIRLEAIASRFLLLVGSFVCLLFCGKCQGLVL